MAKNKTEVRKCAQCGKTFGAKAVNQRFCSVACKRAFARIKARAASKGKDADPKPSGKSKPSAKDEVKRPRREAIAKKDRADSLPTVRGAVCVQRIVLPKSAEKKAKVVESLMELVNAVTSLVLS